MRSQVGIAPAHGQQDGHERDSLAPEVFFGEAPPQGRPETPRQEQHEVELDQVPGAQGQAGQERGCPPPQQPAPDRARLVAGESPGGISQAVPPEAFPNLAPDSDGYLWIKYDKYHESFCQDLDADEAWAMSVAQKAPLASTFGDAITAPAWKVKPSWYQVSSADRMINPENQRSMSARMNPRKIITLDAGHASLASRPDEVTALIVEAAEAV